MLEVVRKFMANRIWVGLAANRLHLDDDDGVTVIHVFNLLDADGGPAASSVSDRVPL